MHFPLNHAVSERRYAEIYFCDAGVTIPRLFERYRPLLVLSTTRVWDREEIVTMMKILSRNEKR